MTTPLAQLDATDDAILVSRLRAFNAVDGPRVGDYIRFADGTERRISHIWPADWHDDNLASIQTSKGGSFYLGEDYCSFSGSLYSGVKENTLTPTSEAKRGSCWFFHHDHKRAHNGVDVEVPFRVFECSLVPEGSGYASAEVAAMR